MEHRFGNLDPLNLSVANTNMLSFLDALRAYLLTGVLLLLIQTSLFAQNKRGGPPPSTQDNTTLSETGNNKRFPSNQNATTDNANLRYNKNKVKKKQAETAKFKGEESVVKSPNAAPADAHKPGRTSPVVDQSNYQSQRKTAKGAEEKPHLQMHEHQGDIIIKKRSKLDGQPENVDHRNQKSALVDHSKYQGQRKKAFENKEATMEDLNSQGSMQYGDHGDEANFSLEKRKAMRQSKDRARFEYAGDELPKIVKPVGTTYSGDIDNSKREEVSKANDRERAKFAGDKDISQRLETRKENDRERAEYRGDKDISKRIALGKELEKERAGYTGDINLEDRDKKRREKEKEQAEYTGDINLEARDETRRSSAKEIANYSGDMELESRDKMRRQKQKEIAENSGDISMNDVMRRAREIRKKEKTISKYSGDILVKTLRERDNRIRIKAKKIANWEGDIVIAKKRKGAHPSAVYAGGKTANSYKAKEKYRKKMLKKYGRNPSMETPNYQRKKYKGPTYDKDEGKIWDVQKYKESKTKD